MADGYCMSTERFGIDEVSKYGKHRPFRVVFRQLSTRGVFKGIENNACLTHVSRERAQAWIDGVRKNCKDWSFVGEPVIEPNPFFEG